MKSNFVFQALMVLIACVNVGASVTNSPIRKNFVKFAVLSDDEFDLVVKLAKSRGMTNIAEVSTFDYIPGNIHHGILVTSSEKVDGRKITFQTLEIFREGWHWKAKPPNSSNVISLDKFWVEGLASWPKAHQLTTFATPKGVLRVNVDAEIQLAIADKIIKAFTTGKILYADDVLKLTTEHIKLSQPKRLTLTKRTSDKDGPPAEVRYNISFSETYDELEFVLIGDQVKVVSLIQVAI